MITSFSFCSTANCLSAPLIAVDILFADRFSKAPVLLSNPRAVPPLADLPLPEVCQVLYGA